MDTFTPQELPKLPNINCFDFVVGYIPLPVYILYMYATAFVFPQRKQRYKPVVGYSCSNLCIMETDHFYFYWLPIFRRICGPLKPQCLQLKPIFCTSLFSPPTKEYASVQQPNICVCYSIFLFSRMQNFWMDYRRVANSIRMVNCNTKNRVVTITHGLRKVSQNKCWHWNDRQYKYTLIGVKNKCTCTRHV